MDRTALVELLEPGSVELAGSGSVKALVTVLVGDMEVRGFRIIDLGDDELLVASPKFEIVRDGQEEHRTVVRFADTKLRIEFNDWMLRCYREKLATALEAGSAAKTVAHKVKSTPVSQEECPFCGTEFEADPWVDGECPKCGEDYYWDEVVSEDLANSWESLRWTRLDQGRMK